MLIFQGDFQMQEMRQTGVARPKGLFSTKIPSDIMAKINKTAKKHFQAAIHGIP